MPLKKDTKADENETTTATSASTENTPPETIDPENPKKAQKADNQEAQAQTEAAAQAKAEEEARAEEAERAAKAAKSSPVGKKAQFKAERSMMRDPHTHIAYYPDRITETIYPEPGTWLDSQLSAGLIKKV